MRTSVYLLGVLVASAATAQVCDTELLSGTQFGWTGNDLSIVEDISDDGRFVVMNTRARDLFDWSIDGNSFTSFLAGYDRLTGNSFAYQGNLFYNGGRNVIVDPTSARIGPYNVVVFDSLRDFTGNEYRGYYSGNSVADRNGVSDIYVRGVDWSGVTRVSMGYLGDDANGPSAEPDMNNSAYGWAQVVFHSEATNLVPGDTNGFSDVFLREYDHQHRPTRLLSRGPGGAPADGPSDSAVIAGGSSVTGTVGFRSEATNLVAGDTNGVADIFVIDLANPDVIERVSVSTGGGQANGHSTACAISDDGEIVCFRSWADNLVPGDTNDRPDVFVHYRRYNYTKRVSVSTSGAQADLGSFFPGLSADGRYVVFTSSATTLVAGDTNGSPDAFVHDLWTGRTIRASVGRSGGQLTGTSRSRTIDGDGRTVAFTSDAADTGWTDFNGESDAFIRIMDCDAGEYCPADFVPDGIVDTRDFIGFLDAWARRDPRADYTHDYLIDTRDFIAFLNAWSAGC